VKPCDCGYCGTKKGRRRAALVVFVVMVSVAAITAGIGWLLLRWM